MPTEKEKFAFRLNEALDDSGFPQLGHGRQSELAKVLDVTPQQAGKWLKGQDFPRTSKLVQLAKQVGVRSNWLLSGVGAKYPGSQNEEDEGAGVASKAGNKGGVAPNHTGEKIITHEAFDLALKWMDLQTDDRNAVKTIILSLSEQADL